MDGGLMDDMLLFDLVICEGLVGGQKNAKEFAKIVSRFTKPGGVFVLTCHDEVGMFTDLLRCLIGTIITEKDMPFERKIELLLPIFRPHLKNLKGMSRSYKDWTVDQIINKALWRDSNLFSIADAIDALDFGFDVHGVSPFIFIDWRWYKDIFGDRRQFNMMGKDCYQKNIHNFLDYQYEFPPRSIQDNQQLLAQCHTIWQFIVHYGYERKGQYIDAICREIFKLEEMVRIFSPVTADALKDFLIALEKYPDITPKTDWGRFAAWWGRGMQYLSFIRSK